MSRTRDLGNLGEAETARYLRKRERLRTAAACWLSMNDLTDAPARFDVAEVYVDENGRVLRMEYLEDAFS